MAMWVRSYRGVARASRWALLPAAWCGFAGACADDSEGPSANGGRAGSSEVAGAGGFSGQGSTGSAGRGTSGCGPVAPQEPEDDRTHISGEGFDYPDGTAVTATIGRADPSDTATTSIEGGAFEFALRRLYPACAPASALPVALYVDVDGNGSCQLATDDVFVRSLSPVTAGRYAPLSLSEDSEHCPALPADAAPGVITAARRLCPEIGDCLPFCSEPEPTTSSPGGFGGFCPESPDGGTIGDLDAGGNDAGDAAVDGGP